MRSIGIVSVSILAVLLFLGACAQLPASDSGWTKVDESEVTVPLEPESAPSSTPSLYTKTIRAYGGEYKDKAQNDYKLPIYLNQGQQLALSFSVENAAPEWVNVMVSLTEPDGNSLGYDVPTRDPAENAQNLSLHSTGATKRGTFIYTARESGFCIVNFRCCYTASDSYVDVLVEYQVAG